MHVVRRGDRGAAVVEIRAILTTLAVLHDRIPPDVDAVYDAPVERAVRAFQQARGLTVTGEVNEETWRAIDAARWALGSRVLSHEQPEALFGDDVRQLQERLLEMGYDLGRADGIFGRRTAKALANFQREVGLVPDGVCGPHTMTALRRLGRKVVGGRPNLLRETERFRAAGPALVDKRIVIDPGHGGGDPGVSVPDGPLRWTEADIAYDLAARLEGRLAAAGMRVHLTRGPSPSERQSESDRASLANELGADLLISIHLDGHASPSASGVATYHYGQYGDAGVTSTLGERLAALVPPPRRPLLAYHGVLAPRAEWRSAIIPKPAPDGASADAGSRSPGRWPWARLLRRAHEEAQQKEAAVRRAQVGTGERAEKIRTYNFAENRVTDHRIKLTTHRLHDVLEGDLDEFVDALLGAERARQLGGDGRG